MAKYKYKGTIVEGGAEAHGTVEAASVKGAMAMLLDRGFEIKDLKEKKSVLQFELTKKKIPAAELMNFSRQLAAFVRAGIPLIEAIDVILEEADDKTLRNVLSGVHEALSTGETFSAALSAYETMFPKFYIDMVRAAELTGALDEVLDELSRYIERDVQSKQTIKSAMMYPTVIAVMAVGTIVVLSTFVLPRFKVFFSGFGAELPLPTRMLLAFTAFTTNWWWAILLVIGALLAAFMVALRTSWGQRRRDKLLLRLPIMGQVISFAIIERFCRLLSAMMSAGVPLPDAMAVLGQVTNNVIYRDGIAAVREAMMRGDGLARPLGATKLFPGAVTQMVRVGENTGTLDSQLVVASDYYGRELEYKVKKLTSLFEPAVIIIMGACVGFVAIAMISAMYGIYHQLKFS